MNLHQKQPLDIFVNEGGTDSKRHKMKNPFEACFIGKIVKVVRSNAITKTKAKFPLHVKERRFWWMTVQAIGK